MENTLVSHGQTAACSQAACQVPQACAKPGAGRRMLWLVAGGLLGLVLWLYLGANQDTTSFASRVWVQTLAWVGKALLYLNAAALLWRIYLVLTYKPVAAVAEDALLPAITVVVPAYNEGCLVMETLKSIVTGDYPADKLQVIAVDDGSQDDTWDWLKKAAEAHPGRVELIQQPRNMGKRHALYAGFHRANGEVLVTIDSDSIIDSDTLRKLVSPMVHDRRVAGVGGNVRVLNLKAGLIPRMMEVAYTFGFDFLRASQSRVNTVMCTPGALSAYRRDAVMPVLDRWLNEMWLGKPYCIGEDRYLTNLILRQGFHVVFQSTARVWTNVPTSYKGLAKMLLRWARSDVRESVDMCSFVFKRFRTTGRLGTRVNICLSWIDMTITQLLFVVGMISLVTMPLGVILTVIAGAAIGGLIPATVYFCRHRHFRALWGMPYSVFYFVALSWIPVYAMLTVHKSGWLTRQIQTPAAGAAAFRLRPAPAMGFMRRLPIYAAAGLVAVILGSGASMIASQSPAPNHLRLGQSVAMADPVSLKPAEVNQGLAYTHIQNGQRRWHIAAADSRFQAEDETFRLRGVELVFYTNNGGEIRLHSDEGSFDPRTRAMTLNGNVVGTTPQGVTLATNSLRYNEDDLVAVSEDEVTLSGPAFKFRGRGIMLDVANNRAVFKKSVSSRISNMRDLPQFGIVGS